MRPIGALALAALTAATLLGSAAGTASGASPAFSTSEGAFLTFDDMKGAPYAVEYDGRSFAVGGQRTLWLSGSVHPARVPPGEWAGTLRQMRRNGLNMVQVYVFWNAHEPAESGAAFSDAPGSTDWDVVDLKRFVSIAASEGLFVNLRIGPYVCAEWKFGGLPLWLMNATAYPDLLLRTNEPTWMRLAEDWFRRVAFQLAEFLAPVGGPIVLTQVENELAYDAPEEYVRWAGAMAREAVRDALEMAIEASETTRTAGEAPLIPILMCEGSVAPDAVPACNGPTCAEYLTDPSSRADMYVEAGEDAPGPKQVLVDFPGVWTENEGGYQTWGGSPSEPRAYFWGRGADDVAWASMRWFARGGSHMNYYMFMGGSNFGTSGGDAMATAYATDVNVCPDGLPNEPKFSHLGNMHAALREAAPVLLGAAPQVGRAAFLPHHGVLVGDADGDGLWEGAERVPLTDEAVKAGVQHAAMGASVEAGRKRGKTGTRSASGVRREKSVRDVKADGVAGVAETGAVTDASAASAGAEVVSDAFAKEVTDAFAEVTSRKRATAHRASAAGSGFTEVSGNVVAFEYDSRTDDGFAAFLENNSPRVVVADFKGGAFTLAAWSSVLVVGDASDLTTGRGGMRVAFNSSDVPRTETLRRVRPAASGFRDWRAWREPVALDPRVLRESVSVTAPDPLPQIALTGDRTSFLWYHASFEAPALGEGEPLVPRLWLKIVGRGANRYSVFLDGAPVAAVSDETHSPSAQNQEIEHWVDLGRVARTHVRALAILSESLGVSNYPIFPGDRPGDFEKGVAYAEVRREDTDEALAFLDAHGADRAGDKWRMRVGLYGEALGLQTGLRENARAKTRKRSSTKALFDESSESSENEASFPKWSPIAPGAAAPGVTWLRAAFDADALGLAPGDALLLDARGLGRGHAWVNGHDLGLYWTIARDDAPFEETQRYYVVPREWLAKNGENEIVFAEAGGTAAFGAALAVARMERATGDEAAEAIWATTGGRQRACEF